MGLAGESCSRSQKQSQAPSARAHHARNIAHAPQGVGAESHGSTAEPIASEVDLHTLLSTLFVCFGRTTLAR
eukprot:10875114-Alexandrium_andersonii.AAC.1